MASRLLQQIESMESAVRKQRDSISGQLRVESPAAFARALIIPVLPAFNAQHAGLSVALRLTEQTTDLISANSRLETDAAATQIEVTTLSKKIQESRRQLRNFDSTLPQ